MHCLFEKCIKLLCSTWALKYNIQGHSVGVLCADCVDVVVTHDKWREEEYCKIYSACQMFT